MENTAQFWLVWNENGHAPTFKHQHPDSAKKEAERLARNNIGQRFHVLSLMGTVEVNPVQWTHFDEFDLPF